MFKPTSTLEFTATNGNTVRYSVDAQGYLRTNARKGDHNQSVSVVDAADAQALAAWLAATVLSADDVRALATRMAAGEGWQRDDVNGGSNV